MEFYDFHVHSTFSEGKSTLLEIAQRAKLLGFSGICIVNYFSQFEDIEKLKKEVETVRKDVGIEIFLGFEAKNHYELNKLRRLRKSYDVLLVRGGSLNLNRKAVETPEVDILAHPEFGRKDPGLNHVMVKLAAKNDVAIEINFREILVSSKASRQRILHNMATNVMLCKKYGAKVIITSGAFSHWEMRDPKILVCMGCLIGLELSESKNSLSKIPLSIIKKIEERRSKKWIMPGVKVVE